MFERLKYWVAQYKTVGITFDWLDKINDEKEICNFIIEDLRQKLSDLKKKPLSDQEVIAYERGRYKQHYEDKLRQCNELEERVQAYEKKLLQCSELEKNYIHFLGFKIKRKK